MPTVVTAWFQRWSSLTAGRLAQGQTPAVGRCTGMGARGVAAWVERRSERASAALLMSKRTTSWLGWFWSNRSQPPSRAFDGQPGVFGTMVSTTVLNG